MTLIKKLYSSLCANRFCYKWNRFLLQRALNGLGVNNPVGSGEKWVVQETLSSLEAPVVFDVGANVGHWSTMVLSINPNAQIYAFEPGQNAFAILVQNPKIRAFNIACSSQKGFATLYDRTDSCRATHASLDEKVIFRLHKGVKTQKVELSTIDDILQELKIERVDLLKIDVEGYEYEVLQGASTALQNKQLPLIQFEFADMNVYRARFLKDFYELLHNYHLYRLLPKGCIPLRKYDPALHELFGYQNLLAVHSSYPSKVSR